MSKILFCLLSTTLFSIVFGYLAVRTLAKQKAGQAILEYVDNHKAKAGTPTMGGIIFIIPSALMTIIYAGFDNQLAIVSVCVMLAFGLIGFLDDYLKIRNKKNLGLKAYQKIIAQGGVAAIITAYSYLSEYVGGEIIIPFTDITINLKWWFIPICFILFIATTNSVNLTDGLDGLAGSTSTIAVLVLGVMAAAQWVGYSNDGDILRAKEMYSLVIYCSALVGGLIGFLWFNTHPAKVFMGDTGSLALGGSIAVIAIFMRNPLIIAIIGIMFIVSCISVIIQVVYFKLTHGKRVFLMAPLHHHLQYKGHKETKIVGFYSIITVCAGIIALLSI